jgi:DNA (cytosine-5)-methyltransferase 1
MPLAYYNEIDPYCAAWLQNLMDAGHIAPGVIDTRSIEDVRPDELAGYTQCHFFAGIGVWSLALRSAGWPDSQRAWTGSCPCQPFSAAGKGAGFADERHLWPAWQHLINQCRPAVIFGEQVASKAVDPWIDLVHADMEGMDYAFGCVPFPSAGVGAPHIRDRTFWVAESYGELARIQSEAVHAREFELGWHCGAGRLADADGRDASAERQQRSGEQRQQPKDCGVGRLGDADRQSTGRHAGSAHRAEAEVDGANTCHGDGLGDAGRELLRLADTTGAGWRPEWPNGHAAHSAEAFSEGQAESGRRGPTDGAEAGPTNGHWSAADWLRCTDGKWRPVEPGTFPLAHGTTNRVGRLRAYGNAINAISAQAFIESYCEARGLSFDEQELAA